MVVLLWLVAIVLIIGTIVFLILSAINFGNNKQVDKLSQMITDIDELEDKLRYRLSDEALIKLVENGINEIKGDFNNLSVKTKNRAKGPVILSILGLIFSIIFTATIPCSMHQVNPGEIAVVERFGNVIGYREPGTHFDFWCSYKKFDTTVQKIDVVTSSYSADAQTMDIQMTVQYKLLADKVVEFYLEYVTMESLSQRIEKVAADNVKSVLSKYTAMKIIETRSAISPEVEAEIKTAADEKYHVVVSSVNLTDISFTDEFEKAVEDKVVAEQQKEAAITKAEQELEVAKLTAEAKIEAAKGDAEAQKIMAAAEAEASALKIVELARSLGFKINEYYTTQTTIETEDKDGHLVSRTQFLEVHNVRPAESMTSIVNDDLSITVTTIELFSTSYEILYDENHTMEDLNTLVIEYVEYLAYLEKWNGELPEVVSGDNGLSIIIPSSN